jgi:hypothetical protein
MNNAGIITTSINNLDINSNEIFNTHKRLARIKYGKDNFGITNIANSYINSYRRIKDETN